MTLHFSVDSKGLRSLWDTVQGRQRGARDERHVEIELTSAQVRKLHPPKLALELEATIIKDDDGKYVVWFGLPEDPGGWLTNAFVAGEFETFDAATAAIHAIKGVKVSKIATWRTIATADTDD